MVAAENFERIFFSYILHLFSVGSGGFVLHPIPRLGCRVRESFVVASASSERNFRCCLPGTFVKVEYELV